MVATKDSDAIKRELHTVLNEPLPELPKEPAKVIEDVFPQSDGVDFPQLPDTIELDSELAKQAGKWIDTCVEYMEEVSPKTPRLMLESAALFVASVVIARRLVLPMSFGDIFPNLYIQWVARSTVYGKSTAKNAMLNILCQQFNHLLLPKDITPEALVNTLSGSEPPNMSDKQRERWEEMQPFAAQRSWVIEENSGQLAKASKKDYQAGFSELLTDAYDNGHYSRQTIARGEERVDNIYMSYLGISTPSTMKTFLTDEKMRGGGWWARFAIIGTHGAPRKKSKPKPYKIEQPPTIQPLLTKLHKRLPQPKADESAQPLNVTFGDGAFDLWHSYKEWMHQETDLELPEGYLDSAYGRLSTMALKVATILAWLDWQDDANMPSIEIRHMTRAILICESWRSSFHHAMADADVSDSNRLYQRVIDLVAKGNANHKSREHLTEREIANLMRDVDRITVQGVISQALQNKDIESVEHKPSRGASTTVYRIMRDSA